MAIGFFGNGATFSDIIASQFELNRAYAEEQVALAEKYTEDLQAYAATPIITIPPSIDITFPTSITVDPSLVGEIPVAPTNYPTFPDAPTTNDYPFPDAPVYTLPVVPTLSDITFPSFVEGIISPLSSQMPISGIVAPAITEIVSGGQAPEDNLTAAVRKKLTSNIEDGGTMLNTAREADIWNRDRERREQALRDLTDKTISQWAKLGWTLPDGLLAGALIAINNEYLDKDIDASLQIAIEQAKLEQDGMFKSIEMANQFETMISNNFNEYAKRVYEVSRTVVEETIQVFKAEIDLYNSNLQAFKTDVETYKIAIEAELARSEVFKTRMEAVGIAAQADQARVQAYVAQLSGIAQQVEVFKTTIQAVGMMYEVEKQKIESYKARVDAYSSEIDGVTKRYIGEVEGFKAYVGAYSASADVQVKLTDAQIRAQIAEVDATIKAWEVQTQMALEDVRIRLEAFKTSAATSSTVAAGALSAGHSAVSLTGQAALEGIVG